MRRIHFTILSGVLVVVLLALYSGDLKYSFCGDSRVLCWQKFNLIFILAFLGPALLISSLAFLKVSDTAFETWKKMTLYFVPAYIVIIVLMPWSVGDEIAGFTKGMVGLVLCAGYAVFSVIYLIKNKKN